MQLFNTKKIQLLVENESRDHRGNVVIRGLHKHLLN